MSMPLPATSVATRISLAPCFKLANAYSLQRETEWHETLLTRLLLRLLLTDLCSWFLPPCKVAARYYVGERKTRGWEEGQILA